ncbi:MAG: hypothetical protein GX220_05020 [Treponema sp.]|nr:hypothetical protein [Treponema sp.]
MKNFFYTTFIFSLLLFTIISCASKIEPLPITVEVDKTEPEIIIQPIIEQKTISKPEPTKTIEISKIKPAEEQKIEDKLKDEYERSISQLQGDIITTDNFTQDKKSLLNIISELSFIMENKDYNGWLNYLTQESIYYWRDSSNLAAVSKRLPIKGLRLRNLEDYFKYVFIPSRLNKDVDEIRYVSSTLVKVVKMREKIDSTEDVIYYTFEKINGKWLLCLDKLE